MAGLNSMWRRFGTAGTITENNEFGIYGKLTQQFDNKENLTEVATRFQIKEGPAEILCDIDGTGVKNYSVDITKISKDAVRDNKGLIIKITDEDIKIFLEENKYT